MTQSLYEQLGGEAKLRAIVTDFVERVFSDMMIGFFFRDANKARVTELELQHAAEHLGGPVAYRGRPLQQAHAPHPILGGHFDRRLQILREVLADHHAPQAVIDAWIAHNESLRAEVTRDPRGRCID